MKLNEYIYNENIYLSTKSDLMPNINSNFPADEHYMNKDLVSTVQDCEATCEHMTHHLKMHYHNDDTRTRQAILLRDCADIRTLTAKFLTRNSMYAKHAANLCADICCACSHECAKFPDQMSQHCAQICFHCARECRVFASM